MNPTSTRFFIAIHCSRAAHWPKSYFCRQHNDSLIEFSSTMKASTQVIQFPYSVSEREWWKDRIICGDSQAVLRSIPDESIHLAITSPPYNVGLQYDSHHDKMPYEEYLTWLMPIWTELKRVLTD
ncbi:MAG: DNA methyltransferase, partial [Verrucomicrobiia bacterium]